MTKRPMYLQHVNVYVRNVERSKKWYEDLLGLHVYEYRPGWAAFLTADKEQSHEVALMQLGEDAPLQSKGQVGLNHMAWRLESLDDLKEFYRKIKAEGQPIDRIVDHGISLGIYLRDPDGNGVEVFYEMPRAEWPVDYNVFTREKTGSGRFPGPWDAEIGRDGSPAGGKPPRSRGGTGHRASLSLPGARHIRGASSPSEAWGGVGVVDDGGVICLPGHS